MTIATPDYSSPKMLRILEYDFKMNCLRFMSGLAEKHSL